MRSDVEISIRQSFDPKPTPTADVTVFFDIFRASTTLAALASRGPAEILSTNDLARVKAMTAAGTILISEVFAGGFDNSPSQILAAGEINTKSRIVHKSTNLTTAIFAALPLQLALVAGFSNMNATVRFIRSMDPRCVELIPAGHRNLARAAIEDTAAAETMADLLRGDPPEGALAARLAGIRSAIRDLKARREDLAQHYWNDVEIALALDRFGYVLQAVPHSEGVLAIRVLTPED